MTKHANQAGLDFTVVEIGGDKEHISPITLKSGEETCIVVTPMGVNIPTSQNGALLSKEAYLNGDSENYIELICEDENFEEFVVTTEGKEALDENVSDYLLNEFFHNKLS